MSPSVSSLRKVLAGIPMSLGEFFTTDFTGERPRCSTGREELTDLGTGDVHLRLVAAQRKERAMSVMHETYPPGSDTGEEMLTHEGEEVRRGGPRPDRGDRRGHEARCSEPGDAYYFDSTLPHRFRNPGDEDCEIVSANTPPSF